MVLRGCLIITIIFGLCVWANSGQARNPYGGPYYEVGEIVTEPEVATEPVEWLSFVPTIDEQLSFMPTMGGRLSPTPTYTENKGPTITSLTPNPRTQILGQWVRWTAYATDPEGDTIYYKFVMDTAESDWSISNQWDWYPSQAGTFYCTVYVCDDVGVYILFQHL